MHNMRGFVLSHVHVKIAGCAIAERKQPITMPRGLHHNGKKTGVQARVVILKEYPMLSTISI